MATRQVRTSSIWSRALETGGARPKFARIVDRFRKALTENRLRPGDRVPSVAELADSLGVNRTTVVRAFRELERAGLLVSMVGKGSFVADGAGSAGSDRPVVPTGDRGRSQRGYARPQLGRASPPAFAEGLFQLLRMPLPPGTIRFGSGVPDADSVDPATFRAAADEAIHADFGDLFTYAHYGFPALRAEIARWLSGRGYPVDEASVLVTNGSQEALSLIANWSRQVGRAMLCESPTYVGIPLAFSYFGHAVESVPREGGGLGDRLRERAQGRSTTFYCCADFHNPTGSCLTDAERTSVAKVAEAEDLVVIVDDLFRDLRFEGEEPRSLYDYLPLQRRVLVGSFSKSFIPGLRAGFLVADPDRIAAFSEMKRTLDLGSPTLSQATAAGLLRDAYPAHLPRVRARYLGRRDALVKAMETHFPDGVTFTRPEGGFQLWAQMPVGYSSVHVYLRALARGVQISPGPAHDIEGRYLNGFRLSYSQASRDDIERGIPILGDVLREVMAAGPHEPSASGLGFPL